MVDNNKDKLSGSMNICLSLPKKSKQLFLGMFSVLSVCLLVLFAFSATLVILSENKRVYLLPSLYFAFIFLLTIDGSTCFSRETRHTMERVK